MASVYKRGSSWWLQWRDKAGTRHRTSLGSVARAEAQAALTRKQREIVSSHIAPPSPAFGTYARDYLSWYAQQYPHTYVNISRVVERLILEFEFQPLDQLRPALVEAWRARRARELSKGGGEDPQKVKTETVNKDLRTLKAMLNRAVEWEIIAKNPAQAVKQLQVLDSRPPRFYSIEQLQALYDKGNQDRRWAWQLFANTGMRRMEGLHLRRRDVKSDRILILSDQAARTKSGKWREVPLSAGATAALERLPGKDHVLPQVTPESLSRGFHKDAGRAKIGGNLHALRHTFCSHLVMRGVPLRAVQLLAGHAHYKTTERYATFAPDRLNDSVVRLAL